MDNDEIKREIGGLERRVNSIEHVRLPLIDQRLQDIKSETSTVKSAINRVFWVVSVLGVSNGALNADLFLQHNDPPHLASPNAPIHRNAEPHKPSNGGIQDDHRP